MSEHGPYNQPPHNPYGGGEHGGGQPPYGQPYGDPNTGGQPGPPGQPYGDPNTGGQPGFNTGGQPGPYPGGPYPGGPEQQMYGGGQPPYGGGPPGYPQQQPPQNNESKAGLWVVIGGGAVIVVLVIAVVAMLITNGSGGDDATAASDDSPETSDTEGDEGDDGDDGDDTEPEDDGGGADAEPAGEPPYDVPIEPCDAFTDQVQSDFLLTEDGDKSVQDSNSTCRSSLGDPPEGNPEEAYGSLNIAFSVPPSAADSTDRASEDFQSAIDDVTGQSNYSLYYAEDVDEDKAVELGDEAHFVTTMYDFAGEDVPQAVLLIRTENLNIRVEYQVSGMFLDDEGDSDDLQLPDNVEEIMLDAGEDALGVVGTS